MIFAVVHGLTKRVKGVHHSLFFLVTKSRPALSLFAPPLWFFLSSVPILGGDADHAYCGKPRGQKGEKMWYKKQFKSAAPHRPTNSL